MAFSNNLLAAIDLLQIHGFIDALSESPLDRGTVLFEPGDPTNQVYFPTGAVLSVITLMSDGRAVESSTIGSESGGPLLSALAGEVTRNRILAQIGGAAMKLPSAKLRTAAGGHPKLMSLLLRHACAISQQAEQGVACNVLHEADSRLARWILMTQDRTGSASVPLTQEHMAVMTGVQRTTISAVASELRHKGLIRYRRGVLEVVDRSGLEAIACECYTVIRQSFDELRPSKDEPAEMGKSRRSRYGA